MTAYEIYEMVKKVLRECALDPDQYQKAVKKIAERLKL